MRLAVVSSLVVLVACGGSQKPAEPLDTSSLEGSGSSAASPSGETPSSTEKPAAPPHAASPPSDSAAAPADAPAPTHPVPAATGSIDGKPFEPKLARVVGAMQKDGRVLISVGERADCTGGDLKAGEASLSIVVPWESGYKVDIGSLKRGGRKGPGEISFARVDAGGKKAFSATFKPSGTVTVVKAPTAQNDVGKLKIDLQSGDYMLAGDLDVQVCVAPK